MLKAKENKIDLNTARRFHGLEKWQKVDISWETIAEKKLGFLPNTCKVCKRNLEVLEVALPQRGPPVVRFNQQAIDA